MIPVGVVTAAPHFVYELRGTHISRISSSFLHSTLFAKSGNRRSIPLILLFLFISRHLPAHARPKLKRVFNRKIYFFWLENLWIRPDYLKYINVVQCWKHISVTSICISVMLKRLNYLSHPPVSLPLCLCWSLLRTYVRNKEIFSY